MQAAAAACSYERATVLRDHLKNLKWLDRRMKDLRNAKKKFNGILPVEARRNRIAWLILKGGRLLGSAAEPEGTKRAMAAIDFLTQKSIETDRLPQTIMEMNLQMIIMSWFRKYKDTAKSLVPFEDAIELCQRRARGEPASSATSYSIAAESKTDYRIG